ncbi:hypothetical protein Leryth_001316 [Lithospermum erythrorhizon]|nr:hypothetical protein Leryth_001316 [Lithospermum erythrorhizon]
MQGATASSQYHKTYHSRRPRDEKDKDVFQDRPSDQGYGKGRPKLPNGDGLHDQYGYKAHAKARGHEKGRDGLHGAHSHHGYERGREYLPNRGARCGYRSYAKARGHESYDFLVSTRLHGRGYPSGRTKALRPVEKFTEEFNFEAMNEKFNKEEVWGLFGESTTAAISGHKNVDGTDTNIGGAPEAEEDGPVKVDNTPVYCKDDFFDTLSSNTLDQQSGRGRVTFYERRKLDSETFGEIQRHQQGRGIQGSRRAGGSQGSYRGRGYDHRGRGRGRTVYSRVT